MMTLGALITKDGVVSRTWRHVDPTVPCGIDIPVESGDRIILCDDLDAGIFEHVAGRLHDWTADDLLALADGAEVLTVPELPGAKRGHWYCFQPGYRRICLRPHDEELDRQTGAAIKKASRDKSVKMRMPKPLLRRLAGHDLDGNGDEPIRYGLEFPHHDVVHTF